MRSQTRLFFLAIVFCFATSCKKHIKKPVGAHTNIYLAGGIRKYYSKQEKDTIFTAVYWKNGVMTELSDSVTSAEVKGIAVHGNDVYVVGYIRRKVNPYYETGSAVYWKNGVQTQLGQGVINGIAFSGNDLYMVGTGWGKNQDQAVYWKNGKAFTLGKGRLEAIFVDGDDIYIAGCRIYTVESPGTSYLVTEKSYYPAATYWKNGDPVALNDTTNCNTTANGIFVQDGDVYTIGSDNYKGSVPVGWKNQKRFELGSKLYPSSYISGIAIDDSDRSTLCGSVNVGHYKYRYYDVAAYWKNSRLVSLRHTSKSSGASCIAMLGNDIYIGGNDGGHPVYWKDGTRYEVGKVNGGISAIAIVNY